MRSLTHCLLLLLLTRTSLAWSEPENKQKQEPYTLSICACFQNEAKWLKEWIEFHKVVGVEHFYLYSHNSLDNPRRVLKPYIDSGDVDLIQVDRRWDQCGAQMRAYNECRRRFGHRSKWIAYIDVDEFLFPVYEDDLKEVLKDYEEFGGLAVHWLYFGTSGVDRLEDGELLIERLTQCAPPSWYKHRCVKTIAQPSKVRLASIHHCHYKKGFSAVDSNKRRVSDWKINYPLRKRPLDRIRINHYWVRTRDWAFGEKLRRLCNPKRNANGQVISLRQAKAPRRRELARFDALCDSYGKDKAIQRFVPALRERLEKEEQTKKEKPCKREAA